MKELLSLYPVDIIKGVERRLGIPPQTHVDYLAQEIESRCISVDRVRRATNICLGHGDTGAINSYESKALRYLICNTFGSHELLRLVGYLDPPFDRSLLPSPCLPLDEIVTGVLKTARQSAGAWASFKNMIRQERPDHQYMLDFLEAYPIPGVYEEAPIIPTPATRIEEILAQAGHNFSILTGQPLTTEERAEAVVQELLKARQTISMFLER